MRTTSTIRPVLVALLLGPLLTASATAVVARDLPDFTQLVEDNAAAVVNISTRSAPGGARCRSTTQP